MYVYYPCETRKGLEITFDMAVSSRNVSNNCFELSKSSHCHKYYTSAFLPNIFGMHHIQDAELIGFTSLSVIDNCHQYIEEFFCRLLLPECTPDDITSPCRSLCEEVLLDACAEGFLFLLQSLTQKEGIQIDPTVKVLCRHLQRKDDGKCYNAYVSCPSPKTIEHGYLKSRPNPPFKLNDSAMFSCEEGYDMEGDPIIYCQYSGSWSNLPKCLLQKSKKKERM